MCIRDRDVDQLLADTDAQDHADDIKNWYDGYHFGLRTQPGTEVYTQEEALEMLKIYQLAEINKGKSGNV